MNVVEFPFRRILRRITMRAYLRELEIESAGNEICFKLPEENKKASTDSDEQVKDI